MRVKLEVTVAFWRKGYRRSSIYVKRALAGHHVTSFSRCKVFHNCDSNRRSMPKLFDTMYFDLLTFYQNLSSNFTQLSTGVTQGGLLRPVLFTFCWTDLPEKTSVRRMYKRIFVFIWKYICSHLLFQLI